MKEAERLWDANKTAKSAKMTAGGRLDFQRGLTAQSLNSPYLVLYNASATNANAVVVEQGTFDRPFVVADVAYWYGTNDRAEADYLTAFLNANTPNEAIKAFQAKGLFGERHVHKTILEVPLPAYDAANPVHQSLAAEGRACAAASEAWLAAALAALPPDAKRPSVGALRSDLRKHLAPHLARIDKLLAKA